MKNCNRLVLILCVVALGVLPCFAECPTAAPTQTGDPVVDVYNNLRYLECNFPFNIQSDPIIIGYTGGSGRNPCQLQLMPPNNGLAPYTPITSFVINGQNAIIAIADDRSSPYADSYSFDPRLTAISDANGTIWQEASAYTRYPTCCQDATVKNNTLWTRWNVGGATSVAGAMGGSTIGSSGNPSQVCQTGSFAATISRDPKSQAIGTFTVPFLPLAMNYAITVGEKQKNSVTFTDKQSVATTISTSVSSGSSKKVPGSYDGSPNSTASALKAIKPAAAAVSPILGGAVDFVASNLGSVTGSTETGSTDATTGSMTNSIEFDANYSIGPTNYAGNLIQPGLDDLIWVQLGSRLAWVVDNNHQLKLLVLGAKTRKPYAMRDLIHDRDILIAAQQAAAAAAPPAPDPCSSANAEFDPNCRQGSQPAKPVIKTLPALSKEMLAAMKNHLPIIPVPAGGSPNQLINPELDLQTIQGLLTLDPLMQGGASVDFTQLQYQKRFRPAKFYGTDDELSVYPQISPFDETVIVTTLAGGSRAQSDFTTTIEDDKPGLLGEIFSFGPQTAQTLTQTSSVGSSDQTLNTNQKSVKLHIEVGANTFVARAYRDMIFDTFVFQEVPDASLQAEGVATDDSGNPQGNQWISLSVGNLSIRTRTDAQGRYAFYSSNKTPGKAQLKIGGKVKTIDIAPMLKTVQPLAVSPSGAGVQQKEPVCGGCAAADLVREATALAAAGKLDEAIAKLQAAVKVDPNQASIWTNLGQLLTKRARWTDAEAALRKAIQLDPNGMKGMNHADLAVALLHQGKFTEAAKEAQEAWREGLRNHPIFSTFYQK